MKTVKFTGQVVSVRCEKCLMWFCVADTFEGQVLPRRSWHCCACHYTHRYSRFMDAKEAKAEIAERPETERDEEREKTFVIKPVCCEKRTIWGILSEDA